LNQPLSQELTLAPSGEYAGGAMAYQGYASGIIKG